MHKIFHYLQQVYQKFHLNALLPFAILISYTLIGAAIFRNLELELDLHERELFRQNYNYAFDQITKRILELRCDDSVIRYDKNLQVRYTEEAVNWFLDYTNLTDVIRERNASSPWSWYGSMFYAGQLYTTIGYGLPVAKTLAGQIASIFYIMFGIPIFLIILKHVGRLLSRTFRKCYKRSRSTGKKVVGNVKKISASMKTLYNHNYLPSTTGCVHSLPVKEVDLDPEVGTRIQKSTKKFTQNAFSIPIALALLILWIGFSAALFCLYEPEWGYLTSVYFFFVSISTVGLGDIVPGNKDMMLGYFLLILIGLALLSMCVDLIQVALERILAQLLQEYIDEIERVAAIAKNGTDFESKVSSFEVGVASGLLTVPLDKQYKSMRSLPNRFKEWIAERVANNMIESQLAEMNSDIDSESEISVPFQSQSQEQQQKPGTCRISSEEVRSKPTLRSGDLIDYLWKHSPAIRTVQALEKANFYTPNDDFQSMLFSKFMRSSKLEQFMGQVSDPTPHKHHATTQTNILRPANIATFEEDMHFSRDSRDSSTIQSDIIHQSIESLSNAFDVDSILSDAFVDIEFTEACAPLIVSHDSASTCPSIASSQITYAPLKLPVDSASKWKPKWQRISRSVRRKSCCGTPSSHSSEGSTTGLIPFISNTQLSRKKSSFGSLP
ncbi:Ion channel family protein [Acanthocheilonema viteae]